MFGSVRIRASDIGDLNGTHQKDTYQNDTYHSSNCQNNMMDTYQNSIFQGNTYQNCTYHNNTNRISRYNSLRVEYVGSPVEKDFYFPGSGESYLHIAYNGPSRGEQTYSGNWTVPEGKYISVKMSPFETFVPCTNKLATMFLLAIPPLFEFHPCYNPRHYLPDPTDKSSTAAFPDTRNLLYHSPLKTVGYYIWLNENSAAFRINITVTAKNENRRDNLSVSYASGTVIPYGFDGSADYAVGMRAWAWLWPPTGYSVMISFPYVDIAYSYRCTVDRVHLANYFKWKGTFCGSYQRPPMLYRGLLRFIFVASVTTRFHTGFKARFSFHAPTELPEKLMTTSVNTAVFNCSVSIYSKFKQHLECNLDKECINGEDEANCLYSRGACEQGFLSAGGKCYKYIKLGYRYMTWYDASAVCMKQGLKLASFPIMKEEEAFRDNILHFAFTTDRSYFGLRTSDPSLPAMYREVWRWSSGSMAYYVDTKSEKNIFKPACAAFNKLSKDKISVQTCGEIAGMHYIFCEAEKLLIQNKINLQPLEVQPTFGVNNSTRFVVCTDHVTLDFLSCDHLSRCGADPGIMSCTTSVRSHTTEISVEVLMFVCDSNTQTIHYTQVCDHHVQCFDSSDETFCIYKACPDRQCLNQQCVTEAEWCDGMAHCYDGSDEACPQFVTASNEPSSSLTSGFHVVLFDGHGKYMYLSQADGFSVCPLTHFLCGNRKLCLPVYLRCNGIYDCPDQEDESNCDDVTCPGYYRCLGSAVCVHSDHVCDGVFQCPQHDDELLCELVCPDDCLCQGLAFVCPRPFRVLTYSDLRYLDASESGLTPDQLFHNHYLIRLVLSSCSLYKLPVLVFPNMKFLDLSNNILANISMHVFLNLSKLSDLNLSRNPITMLAATKTSTLLGKLRSIDLSHTKLGYFESSMLANFRDMKTLNLSYSALEIVSNSGFTTLTQIESLDLRGTELREYPMKMLQPLNSLRVVYSGAYKMCCQEVLPDQFNIQNCHTSFDEIASCEDLLRSGVYRLFLWVSCCFGLIGNAASFAARMYMERRKSANSFNVFISNLNIADFFMGLYLAVVGIADLTYRGTYLWHDEVWKTSVGCQIAGFFSLLSCEMSAFMICFITLDRFLVMRFPFSRFHFRTMSAGVVCGCSWVVGAALAAIPLLPVTSDWEFYGQTGICIPLPVTRKKFKGQFYSFGILIVLNFLLFVFIAIGQLFIYMSIRDNSMSTDQKNEREATVARRLLTVVMSDFLCWFPIGVVGLLASNGFPIPGEVNVAMAIFALPVNSALNPFLYTFNLMMEKRRKASEQRLLKLLQSRMKTKTISHADEQKLSYDSLQG